MKMWTPFYLALVFCAALLAAEPLVAGEPSTVRPAENNTDHDAVLKITTQRLCPGTISPYQCGQFIEYLCALTPSMFAEKVFDGSFEGVPAYRFAFRSQTDRLEQPWYPDGAVHRGEFA